MLSSALLCSYLSASHLPLNAALRNAVVLAGTDSNTTRKSSVVPGSPFNPLTGYKDGFRLRFQKEGLCGSARKSTFYCLANRGCNSYWIVVKNISVFFCLIWTLTAFTLQLSLTFCSIHTSNTGIIWFKHVLEAQDDADSKDNVHFTKGFRKQWVTLWSLYTFLYTIKCFREKMHRKRQ